MSRIIPPLLAAHLKQPITTLCRMVLFTFADGRKFGICDLDRDIDYLGITYSYERGFDPKIIATDAGLSVDNSAADILLSADDLGITKEMIAAGDMDDAEWIAFLVNWADLTMGHMILDAGDVGDVTISNRNLVYAPELVSYAMRLRQPIGDLDSRTCRAVFGSPANSQRGCGVDADALWQAGSVTGVGADEPLRVFADSALHMIPIPIPGRVQWLTGDNASDIRIYQVDAYDSPSGSIALVEPLAFPVQIGDTFRIRPDCAKTQPACVAYANIVNMKGEWYIPVGDGLETQTPNSQIVGGTLGSVFNPSF